MVNIPRFEAQTLQIQVPSFKDYQSEQNAQIYKAVANFANTASTVAEKLYETQQIHKAQVAGASGGSESISEIEKSARAGGESKLKNLNDLPIPYTKAQAAYNEAAIASFSTDFTVEAERVINESAFKNKENPQMFLEETDAYINGVSKNIPDYLKKQILKPVQMARESKYDTLLKTKVGEDQKKSLENLQFNGYLLRQNANYIDSDAALDKYIGNMTAYAQTYVNSGGKAEDAIKLLESAQEDGLNRYLSNYYMKEKIDPSQFKEFYAKVQNGNTGIPALDMMAPAKRIEISLNAFNDLNKSENALAEKALVVASNKEAEITLNIAAKRVAGDETATNPAYGAGYAHKQVLDAATNIQNGAAKQSSPGYEYSKSEKAVKYGALDIDDLNSMKSQGLLGDDDYLKLYTLANSYQKTNRDFPSVQEAISLIVSSTPNKIDEFGDILEVNEKREFMLDSFDKFLDSKKLTNEEIVAFVPELIKQANASFDQVSEYKKNFTPEKFYSTFGVKYNDVNDIAKRYMSGDFINRSQLKSAVMAKYKISSTRANALLTYWDKMRKTEK